MQTRLWSSYSYQIWWLRRNIKYFIKVHIFWADHKILRNLHRWFVLCGLLRIYELYTLNYFFRMSNNVFNNNHEILSDEENIDPIVVVRNTSIQNNSSNQVLNSHSSKSASTTHSGNQSHQTSHNLSISSHISMKSTSKTFISMASESDSGYSVSATPVSSASPAIHHHSREATDSPQGGGLINLDEADLEG